jgi:hypothetical protein
MAQLLDFADLPAGFEYPRGFIRVIELGLIQLEPWRLLEGEQLWERNRGLKERYPSRILVPFARRQDNDDVACWEPKAGDGIVVVVHDFASPGWESHGQFESFYDWLRQAVEDLIEFD